MSEDRFKNYEAEMAQYIARYLPIPGITEYGGTFYRDVMKWCLVNFDLVESFSKITSDDKEFSKCLKKCYEQQDVEAFGLAIAMRLEWLQSK